MCLPGSGPQYIFPGVMHNLHCPFSSSFSSSLGEACEEFLSLVKDTEFSDTVDVSAGYFLAVILFILWIISSVGFPLIACLILFEALLIVAISFMFSNILPF